MSNSIVDLIEEINFWKYMLEEYENRKYMPEYHQITESLALAEYRLETLVKQMGRPH